MTDYDTAAADAAIVAGVPDEDESPRARAARETASIRPDELRAMRTHPSADNVDAEQASGILDRLANLLGRRTAGEGGTP